MKSTGSFEKYLWLPTIIGRAKAAAFNSLMDRVWGLFTNWKTKMLSAVGKEILLKAILLAIPTYTMGIFQLPHSIILKLDRMMKKFW